MKQEAYSILKSSVEEHLELLLSGKQPCLGLLRDYGGREHPEVNLLADAVEDNIPDRLLRSQPVTQQIIDDLAEDFASKRLYDSQTAKFVVSSWADALGLYDLQPEVFTCESKPVENDSAHATVSQGSERMWYYLEGTSSVGPVSEPVIADLALNGQVRSETLVWSEGMTDWDSALKYFPQFSPAPREVQQTYPAQMKQPAVVSSSYAPSSHNLKRPVQVQQSPSGTLRSTSWRKLLWSFEGRIPRRTYWALQIISIGAISVFSMIAEAVESDSNAEVFLGVFGLVFIVPWIWISLAVQVKRWHDRGKSGAMVLISFIPYVGGIWAFIECGCLRGTVGDNKYGKDPN
jgi:uncharacterized membrane protein YhaH (DUF805 family)